MAHEKSITIKRGDGKWVNIPTVIGGKTLSIGDATKQFKAGKLKPLGGMTFDTVGDAVSAAKKRSEGASDRMR